MINNLKASSFAASTAISSGQEAVNSGIQKAAVSPARIAAARDSFEMAAKQSTSELNLPTMSQPATVDDPVAYLNRAAQYGKAISAHAQNQDLLKLWGDPHRDLSADVNELTQGLAKSVKNAWLDQLRPTDKRKELQEDIKKQQEEIKRLQEELQEASDRSSFDEFVGSLFGDDPGLTEKTGPSFAEPARHSVIKKDDDD